jgi:transposase-like protein
MIQNSEDVERERRSLDEIVRMGALSMLKAALEEEARYYVERFIEEIDEEGRRLVRRNGYAQERSVVTGAGVLKVQAPRVDDRRVDEQGNKQKFTSKILPPYMRKSPRVAETLPILYLRGLSTGDFIPALESLLGEDASGLSASSIVRLTDEWKKEYEEFCQRDLSNEDYVYIWVDGVHFKVRLEEDRLCTLVVMGVRSDGHKELLAVVDGYRESTESWAFVLRSLKKRGMKAPLLAIGDGALGFWAALRDVWPNVVEQRCWVHKLANILDKLPKRVQQRAKEGLHEVMMAESREDAQEAADEFVEAFGAKWPKATHCLTKDLDQLLAFYDFPAPHWKHIRSTNPIESAFATVRLRQRTTKGAGSRSKALTMAFKLLQMAQLRWRRINGYALLPGLLQDDSYENGVLIEHAA